MTASIAELSAIFNIPLSEGWFRIVLDLLERRAAEGFTPDDIILTAWWCRARWSVDRFPPYQNPAWWLRDEWFAPLLALARADYRERWGDDPEFRRAETARRNPSLSDYKLDEIARVQAWALDATRTSGTSP